MRERVFALAKRARNRRDMHPLQGGIWISSAETRVTIARVETLLCLSLSLSLFLSRKGQTINYPGSKRRY